ncbi:hypothetical protein T439DRAFT_358647 [Meredithblackwellia eburnea MCA 4105]
MPAVCWSLGYAFMSWDSRLQRDFQSYQINTEKGKSCFQYDLADVLLKLNEHVDHLRTLVFKISLTGYSDDTAQFVTMGLKNSKSYDTLNQNLHETVRRLSDQQRNALWRAAGQVYNEIFPVMQKLYTQTGKDALMEFVAKICETCTNLQLGEEQGHETQQSPWMVSAAVDTYLKNHNK